MYNKRVKRGSLRKSQPEKQQENVDKMFTEKERQSSTRKVSLNTRNSTSIENNKQFGPKCRSDRLEASSSFPTETNICCKNEKVTGVSIKDVGLDIAGFLIEEEIKQNKQKLKSEIIRQIALSRELDKHLERQRHIMNNYICNNTLEGIPNEYPSQNIINIPDKCNCMVCQEAATNDVSTCTSTCLAKLAFSEKSQVTRVNSINYNETIPRFQNSFTQSTPLTKDVSCQDMCRECNSSNKNEQTNNCRSPPKCTPLRLKNSKNPEQCAPCIEGYFEDYSSVVPANKQIELNSESTQPDTDVVNAVDVVNAANVVNAADVINDVDVVEPNDMNIVCPAEKSEEENEPTTELADQTLDNLNNLLNTPLNTIKPESICQQNPREDTTEMILSNIKNIIRDYMENININCTNCKSARKASIEEKTDIRSDSVSELSPTAEDKSDMSTKCENDGTHIDIVMQFSECNKRKKAILEIEPCFDERKCMKYKKKYKKKVCENLDMCTQCTLSSCSICNSQKFSPYPLKDRTSYRKSSKPKITCHSIRRAQNYCKQKRCVGMSSPKRTHFAGISSNNDSSSSGDSVQIIKVNRCSTKTTPICESDSDSSEEEEKCGKAKNSILKNHPRKCSIKKSTICSYIPNMGGFPNKHSKPKRKTSSPNQTSTSRLSKPKKQEYKSNKKIDHQATEPKMEQALNPFIETKKKASILSVGSSNLEETSYREIQLHGKSKLLSKKESKTRRTSNTCTTISLNLESSNIGIPGKCFSKDNETLYAYPSNMLNSINCFEDKNETLTSTNVPDKTTKRRFRESIKASKNIVSDNRRIPHASSSSDPSVDKFEIIHKYKHKLKTDIKSRPEEIVTNSSDETQPTESMKAYPKISSDGGVVILSPLFETKRIQLIQKWLSYIHKLQAKEHFKTIAPAIVAIKLPTSSKYVIPNENSDQQVEYLLTPNPVFNRHFSEKNATNILKQSIFKNFKKITATEGNDNKRTTFEVRNTKTDGGNTSKWSIFRNGKKDSPFKEPIKRTTIKQPNKNTGLEFNKSKSEVLCTESSSSSEYNIIESSLSDSSFESTSGSLLDVNENNHDELIQELICPYKNHLKGKYFDVNETDKIIHRAFYIQDIFVKLASTEEEKEYWRDTVLRAMKNTVTKTS